MARLARSSRAQAQEIPDSYEQRELSLSNSDAEIEDDDSEMIHHQLTQEQPDEEDDDDDGVVNLFLPDIVDIVNKAASTPQKTRAQPQRVSSAQKSSPTSQTEVIATQSTESSTQSQELGHLANYLRKKKAAAAQVKAQAGMQTSSPLLRPSLRSKPVSRGPTPQEQPSQISLGKADPYDVPSSPEAERRPTPGPQSVAEKETSKPRKRKRKEAAPVQRSATPEEPVTSKRPRRGLDHLESSPPSLRKVGRSARAHSSAQSEQEKGVEPPLKRGRGRPKKAPKLSVEEVQELKEDEVPEEPEEGEIHDFEQDERKVPVVMLPIKRTRSRQAELDTEMEEAAAQKPRSLRNVIGATNAAMGTSSSRTTNHKCSKCYVNESSRWHQNLRNEPRNGKLYCNDCYAKDYKKKKAKLSVKRTQPASSPQTGLEILQSPVGTRAKSSKEQIVEEPITQSQPKAKTYPVPKSALAVYREQQQQQETIEEEEEALPMTVVRPFSPIPETPKTRARAKSSSVAPQSASPAATRRPRKHFKQPEGEKEAEMPPPGSQALMTENELGLETVPEEKEGEEEEDEEEVIPAKQERQRRLTVKERAAQKKLERAEEEAGWQQEQDKSLAAEAEKLQKKKARAEKIRPALAEQKAAEKTKEFFQTARATRSRKAYGDSRLDRVEDSEEPEQADQAGVPEEMMGPETLEFNMEDVPESLFTDREDENEDLEIIVEGDREMAEVDEGQAQPLMDDDDEDDEYIQPRLEDGKEEDDEDKSELEDEQTGDTGGINSILMNPSPKEVPSQKIAPPQRQIRNQTQKLLDQNLQRAGTLTEATRSVSPPSAQPLNDDASASTRSLRDEPPAVDEAAEDSATTMDFGRNPFNEPTFNFTEKNFSATSRSFLQNMLLDRDVRELFQLTKDLGTTPDGVARKTQHAKDAAKLRRYLVDDYNELIDQRHSENPEEETICDLYSNVFNNTRKLKKKVNDLRHDDLGKDEEELSHGEQAARNKTRTRLLRDVYLFVVPDILKVITALIETYCTDGSPGMFCFDELYGLVCLTLELERTAEDENNAPYRPKSKSEAIDYQYPKHTKLIKHLRDISDSCQTVQDEQIEYEKAAARERARKRESEKAVVEKQRKHEAFLREQEAKRLEQEEEDAREEEIRKEKLRAWTEKNAHILNKYKNQPIPRQVTQMGYPPSQQVASSQSWSKQESVMSVPWQDDPWAGDIRDVQPIMNGAHKPNPSYQHQLHVLPRRKPIVRAAERGNSLPSTARKHKLPLSNDDSDDDAFGEPQEPKGRAQAEEPRRKFKQYPVTPSGPTGEPVAEPSQAVQDENAFVAPNVDSEEEELPGHPTARVIPRKSLEEEELSLTQQRLNQEQRIKMLKAELVDLRKMKQRNRRAEKKKESEIEETERKKARLEVAEREYYEGQDEEDYVDLDAELDETPEYVGEDEQYLEEKDEEGYQYDDDEEDQSVEVGTSFPGNNNRMATPKPWTREDLNTLIECLKFSGLESKYIEAAAMLDRDQDDVMDTAKEFKEVWEEEYRKKTGEVPEWVRCIGENVACEMDEVAVAGPARR